MHSNHQGYEMEGYERSLKIYRCVGFMCQPFLLWETVTITVHYWLWIDFVNNVQKMDSL